MTNLVDIVSSFCNNLLIHQLNIFPAEGSYHVKENVDDINQTQVN